MTCESERIIRFQTRNYNVGKPPVTRTRISKRTIKLPSGANVVRTAVVEAPELEWRVQAEIIRQLRALPENGERFSVVGDFNAAKRSMREATKAKATGLTPGEPDARVYMEGGRLGLIEVKGERGRLSPAQVERHALLKKLGFDVVVIKEGDPVEAGRKAVDLVRNWLRAPANDNEAK